MKFKAFGRFPKESLDFNLLKNLFMDLYQKLCQRALLRKVWNSVYAGKSVPKRKTSRGIDGITLEEFKKNENSYLDQVSGELISNKFNFSCSRVVAVPKPDKTSRLIAMQIIKDRIVSRAILSLITGPIFPSINNGVSYCGVKEKFWSKKEKSLSRLEAVKKIIQHLKSKHFWVFESDIESFFDQIPRAEMLRRTQEAIGSDQSLHQIIHQALNFEIGNPEVYLKHGKDLPSEGVPQGSALSPLLANLYLSKFDSYMKKSFGDRYIRYVDDFIVMCKTKSDANAAKEMANHAIAKDKLTLKEKKTHVFDIKADPLIFLGLKIDRNEIVPKKKLSEILGDLSSNILVLGNYSLCMRDGKRVSIIEQINEKILGWAYGYRYFHVTKLFAAIDRFLISRIGAKHSPLNGVKLISGNVKLYPIISPENWKKLFQAYKK